MEDTTCNNYYVMPLSLEAIVVQFTYEELFRSSIVLNSFGLEFAWKAENGEFWLNWSKSAYNTLIK